MSQPIQLAKNVDLSKVIYSEVKPQASGGKSVYMSVDNKNIRIQTPRMVCQWGLSKYNPDNKVGSDKYSLDMSFRNMDTKPGIKSFFDKLVELDKKVVDDVTKNSNLWLRKANMTREVVEALSTPSVKYAKDKDTGEVTDKYPPTFRINVPMKDGKPMCDVYDVNETKLDLFDLDATGKMKGSQITAIIKLQGLWFAGGKFGCTWRLEQLRVEPPESIKGFAFQPDEEDAIAASDDEEIQLGNKVETSDDEEDETVVAPSTSKAAPTPTVVEDEDEDDEIEAPKVVKAVAKKKTTK